MKKLILFMSAALLLMTLIACSGEKEIVLDIDKLAEELLERGEFTDELTEVDEKIAALLYEIEDSEAQRVYISSGATAEELALFAFASEEEAEAGLEAVRHRLEAQKADYARYIPEEVPKLEDAFLERVGKYVIFCVSGGPAAEQIIRSNL